MSRTSCNHPQHTFLQLFWVRLNKRKRRRNQIEKRLSLQRIQNRKFQTKERIPLSWEKKGSWTWSSKSTPFSTYKNVISAPDQNKICNHPKRNNNSNIDFSVLHSVKQNPFQRSAYSILHHSCLSIGLYALVFVLYMLYTRLQNV